MCQNTFISFLLNIHLNNPIKFQNCLYIDFLLYSEEDQLL